MLCNLTSPMSREHGGQGIQLGGGARDSRKEGVAEKELGKGKLLPRSLGNSWRWRSAEEAMLKEKWGKRYWA